MTTIWRQRGERETQPTLACSSANSAAPENCDGADATPPSPAGTPTAATSPALELLGEGGDVEIELINSFAASAMG